ncbi:MAG: ribonuclease protein component [Patescibacteria group bacterium]|nr:ribonuclease protein component [Patescibacteria group bacterium]
MLARPNRLRKAPEIVRVYKKGAYGGASGVLSVKAAPSGRGQSRAVVVVGKKVSKRAVIRNRLRRRLAADLYQRWATVRPGYDIVITVHSDVSDVPAAQLSAHLTQALTRVNLI